MGSLEELEGRVAALETQMRNVRQDAAAARVLAGGADRDVSALASRLDAQTRLLQALRKTQVEDHERISGLQGDFSELRGDVADIRRGFSTLAVGQAEILALLKRNDCSEDDPSRSATE